MQIPGVPNPYINVGNAGDNNGVPQTPTPPVTPPVPIDPAAYYRNLIERDPGYLQIKAALEASRTSAGAQRASDIQRALIDFGLVPEGFLSNDVSDLTRNLASQNTQTGLSVAARLAKAQRDAQRDIQNNLAARGILQSGETGFQLGEAQLAGAQSQYDATKQLLDYLAGVQAAFAQSESERNQSLAEAAQDAMQRQMELALATGAQLPGLGPTVPPPLVDNSRQPLNENRR